VQAEIEAVRDDDEAFCANHLWYGYYRSRSFRRDMNRLVSYTAEQDDAMLRSSAAHKLAYEHLYHCLPDCRHTGICGF
jgi:hypothetical protein